MVQCAYMSQVHEATFDSILSSATKLPNTTLRYAFEVVFTTKFRITNQIRLNDREHQPCQLR